MIAIRFMVTNSDAIISLTEKTAYRFDPSLRIESVSVIGRDTDSPPSDEEEEE